MQFREHPPFLDSSMEFCKSRNVQPLIFKGPSVRHLRSGLAEISQWVAQKLHTQCPRNRSDSASYGGTSLLRYAKLGNAETLYAQAHLPIATYRPKSTATWHAVA